MGEKHRFGWSLASVCLFGWALATTYTNHAPLVPVFMERFEFTPTEAGLLSLGFFLAMSAAALPAGLLSDRLGPKLIGTVGLALAGASDVGLAYTQEFLMMLEFKVLGGVGAGLAFIAGVRYVTVVFAPSRVHLAQGLYGGCVQLGAGTSLYLMPLLYARLELWGAFVTAAGLIGGVLAFWIRAAPDRRALLAPARFSLAMRSGAVWLLTLAHTGTFGLSILVGTWITTFLRRDLGLPLSVAGALGSAVLVVGMLSRPGGGVLIDRHRVLTGTMIRGSLLAGTVGLGLLALPGRPVWAALLALLVMGVALSLPYSAVMNTASAAVPASPGAAVGIVGAISLVLIAAGAPALGALYARTESFSLAFGLLGAFCFVVFWLTRLLRRHEEFATRAESPARTSRSAP
jgi:nitrate/nitrite transporter NarK